MRGRTSFEYLQSSTKRKLDIIGGLTIFGALLPAEIMAAVISSVDTGSLNPFFRQKRVGRGGKPIEVVKFRTLPKRVESQELKVIGTYDPRASVVGRAMREIGIDETPQLINVLKGDMSLVGMRPLLQETIDEMEDASPSVFKKWFSAYSALTPAVTGPSQIYRHQYRTHSPDVLAESMRLDLDYIRNASLLNDIRILGSTPLKLVKARINMVDNSNQELLPASELAN